VLHPKYKLAYFQKAQWEQEWIDTAKDMLRDEWETTYKPTIDPSFLDDTLESTGMDVVCSVVSIFENHIS
jgi:hypothetical protein